MTDYTHAANYIHALTGNVDTVIQWRVIHDQNKGEQGRNLTGTLAQLWSTLCEYNANGWGVFCNINAMDGNGSELANVAYIRAHGVDLDNTLTAQADLARACQAHPSPQFTVESSTGKYHVYYRVQPYTGNEFYTMIQRKLAQLYNGDPSIIDATRVMRVPGFLHQKHEPVLVTFHDCDLPANNYTSQEMEAAFAHVNVIERFTSRSPLGTVDMQAPSLKWLHFILKIIDPNDLDRNEWLSMTAAIKQAGWNWMPESELREAWAKWCTRYALNDPGENLKLWNSIRETEVGWASIERRSTVQAYMMFGFKDEPPELPERDIVPPMPQPATPAQFGEMLDSIDCKEYFKDCYFVSNVGEIFTCGRFLNATKFNGLYGGKHFIITSTGKTTDEAWKAALRSTTFTIPKVDHVRFLPEQPLYHVEPDALGRLGINTFIPPRIERKSGDISKFLNHMTAIIPLESDRKILFDYMAHCVKYPGYKIPWAPMLQSTEGIGKTIFLEIMQNALGDMYVYVPKADQLVASGNVFNGWMRGKLLILVNEIKIDERRELIEILKPMITENRIEVQSKGVDQDMEDNAANWLFFSNYKDAIPISKNGRRYCIQYSIMQSKADLIAAGMDDAYFTELWKWLRAGEGIKMITDWLLSYPIERGAIPMVAPHTSSYPEALRLSRSPMEIVINDGIVDAVCGFRGGYISTVAVLNRCRLSGIRNATAKTVATCLETMGYVSLGRATRSYMQEDVTQRSELFGLAACLPLDGYGVAQGYE